MRRYLLVLFVCACAPALTHQGAQVTVYDAKSADAKMSEGCRLIAAKPPATMTEAEIMGQHDPYRIVRNEVAAAGGNALLVRRRMVRSRQSLDCPAASPITDCPGQSGALFEVTFESYSCK